MSVPSITDSYSLVTLPRIPDVKLNEKVSTPIINSTETSIVDLGISKSIISSYLLKPTPKLIWSYPLSPSTIIDCMDVYQEAQVKKYIIGLTERKKIRLLLINKFEKQQGEDNDDINTIEIKLNEKIYSVKFTEDGKLVNVIYQSGDIELYKIENDNFVKVEISNLPITKNNKNKNEVLVYSKFITSHDFKFENDLLLLISKNKKTSQFQYTLISLNNEKSFKISTTSITESSEKNCFCYNSGILYKLNIENKEISSYSISNLDKAIKTISIKNLIGNDGKKDESFSITSPSFDRLLISFKNSIYLINFKFESLLDKYEVNQDDEIFINQIIPTAGSTLRNCETFLIFSQLDKNLNNVDLKIANVNVGLNKLSECLGKSINHQSNQDEFKGLPNLINNSIDEENTKNIKQLKDTFAKLVKARDLKNVNNFEKSFILLVKNEKSDIKQVDFVAFDVDNDKNIDVNFIKKLLSLVFEFDASQNVKLVNDSFIPEVSLIYLLTHPCYPYEYTKGLLKLFNENNQSRLLRQSIITCTTISINELIGQFIHQTNLADIEDYQYEILNELIHRLLSEYSINEITNGFKNYIKSSNNENELNLNKVLNELIKLNSLDSLTLIQVIIDIGGLFNWSISIISELETFITYKLESLIENNFNLTLTNQALLNCKPKNSIANAKHDKNATINGNIISSKYHQQKQLNSILTISNNTDKKIYDDDDDFDFSKKLPKYSIEKLIL